MTSAVLLIFVIGMTTFLHRRNLERYEKLITMNNNLVNAVPKTILLLPSPDFIKDDFDEKDHSFSSFSSEDENA